jgi:hypothetical protein
MPAPENCVVDVPFRDYSPSHITVPGSPLGTDLRDPAHFFGVWPSLDVPSSLSLSDALRHAQLAILNDVDA